MEAATLERKQHKGVEVIHVRRSLVDEAGVEVIEDSTGRRYVLVDETAAKPATSARKFVPTVKSSDGTSCPRCDFEAKDEHGLKIHRGRMRH